MEIKNIVVFALGTNIGKRESNLQKAINLIKHEIGLVLKLSNVYETEPVGFESKNAFLNMCILVETDLNSLETLNKAKDIEVQLGRKYYNDQLYHSRIIDIDIIFFNEDICKTEKLTIPHPLFRERKFVLVPLNDLVPTFIDPISHLSITQLLENNNDNNIINNFNLSLEH